MDKIGHSATIGAAMDKIGHSATIGAAMDKIGGNENPWPACDRSRRTLPCDYWSSRW